MKLKVKNSPVVTKKFKKNSSFSGVDVKKSPKEFGKIRKSLGTFSSTPLQTLPAVSFKSNLLVKSRKEKRKPLVLAPNSNDISTSKKKKSEKSISVKTNESLDKGNIKKISKEEYKIDTDDIENAIRGVLKARETNPKLQNQLFEERSPVFLHITCHKVPEGHGKLFRIPLKHSVLTEEDDICLIVPEIKGVKNKEHEKHVEYYENLLRTKGVTNIKKIMTCHEFRTEHETFEQKIRLVDLYDAFLVDGRVSGKIVHKCGKIFYKKRKVPTSIKLQATQLKSHIEKSLSKVILNLHLKGNGYTVQFGHTKMDMEDLVENVYSVTDFLNDKFPEKFKNIKGVHVFAPRATSIPIYMNMKYPGDLQTPILKSKKPYKTFTDELTTLLNARVTVKPSGNVIVHRISKEDTTAIDDRITDEDIIKGNKEEDKDQSENQQGTVQSKQAKVKKARKNNKEDVHLKTVKKKVDVGKKKKEVVKKNKKRRISEISTVVQKEHPKIKEMKIDIQAKIKKQKKLNK